MAEQFEYKDPTKNSDSNSSGFVYQPVHSTHSKEEGYDPYSPTPRSYYENKPKPKSTLEIPESAKLAAVGIGAGANAMFSKLPRDIATGGGKVIAMYGTASSDLNTAEALTKMRLDMLLNHPLYEANKELLEDALARRAIKTHDTPAPQTAHERQVYGRLDPATLTSSSGRVEGANNMTSDLAAKARAGREIQEQLYLNDLSPDLRAHVGEFSKAPNSKFLLPESVINNVASDLKNQQNRRALIENELIPLHDEYRQALRDLPGYQAAHQNALNEMQNIQPSPLQRIATSGLTTKTLPATGNIAPSKIKGALVGGLGGLGAVLSADEMAQRLHDDDLIGAGIAGVGAVGDAAAMIPLSLYTPALVAKGAGMVAGAVSPLALMAYDKYRQQVNNFLGYDQSVMK